jgi:hypothetical protein
MSFSKVNDNAWIARYLNDLWVFDTQEYQWHQLELKDSESKPSYVTLCLRALLDTLSFSPRSGFSFLSTPDGIVLHGIVNYILW